MNKPLKTLVFAAVLAALIFVFTAFLLHIPIGASGGYLHFGDAIVYLGACLLPLPYAIGAAVIGAGAADLFCGAALWAPATVLIKALMVLCFSARQEKLLTKRNALAVIPAGVIGIGGYYLTESLLCGSFGAPLVSIPLNALQAAGSAALFLLLAFALDKARFRTQF